MSPESKEPYRFSGEGRVYSYTTIHDAPEGFEEFTPYTVAIIELVEGPRITAQMTDLEKKKITKVIDGEEREVQEPVIEIGMPVEMVIRILKKDGDRGLVYYGYKFRPVVESKFP